LKVYNGINVYPSVMADKNITIYMYKTIFIKNRKSDLAQILYTRIWLIKKHWSKLWLNTLIQNRVFLGWDRIHGIMPIHVRSILLDGVKTILRLSASLSGTSVHSTLFHQ